VRATSAQRGFSLPEIMIALVVGLVLLAAFLSVVQRCRAQFSTNESVARLQDSARHALSILVGDLEHAGFHGFGHSPRARLVRAGTVVAAAQDLRQPDSTGAASAVANLPAGAHDCGINFAVDLELPVQGSNNRYVVGSGATDCAPTASAGGARVGSDTLTVRHASLKPAAAHAGRLQIYTRRLAAFGSQDLFADGRLPGPTDEHNVVRDVEVRTYYVSNNSVERPGWPALRVKALTEAAGRAQFRDEEVLPGVEDLQVELGVAEGGVVRYVTPDLATLRAHRIVAVRLWLRIRAEVTEAGFLDNRAMTYADITFVPSAAEATQRRMLIERTVALRNVRDAPRAAP
jgi:type IV pilus assembly protein PilW